MKDNLQRNFLRVGFNIDDAIDYADDESGGIEGVEFEGCCGASIYFGFPQSTLKQLIDGVKESWYEHVSSFLDRTPNSKEPKTPTDKQLEDLIVTCVKNRTRVNLRSGHLFFVILSEPQKWCSQFLTPQGFRLVSDKTVNANTGNRLYVYLYDKENKKPKPMKKRFFGAPSRVRRTSLM